MKRSSRHRSLAGILFLISAIITAGIFWGLFAGVEDSTYAMIVATAVITFILAFANIIVTSRPYGIKVRGYEGIVHRVLKAPGHRNEYFIEGKPESTFREVVRNIWPFADHDVDSSWKLMTISGEDVTDSGLYSYEGIVEIEFAEPEG
ncbi:MAG: hypothetical protein ACTSU3_04350 [Candidatus Thorarchaeota archaeon]